MYRITTVGKRMKRRVLSDDGLSVADFRRLARELGVAPVRARKTARIEARRTDTAERVDTLWNGKETEATAEPGDWIVTALGADGAPLVDRDGNRNRYVVGPSRFAELYEPDTDAKTNDRYRAKGTVEALRLDGGFEIKAPWGETQRAADGWLLLSGGEVYGNHRDTFRATYEIVG